MRAQEEQKKQKEREIETKNLQLKKLRMDENREKLKRREWQKDQAAYNNKKLLLEGSIKELEQGIEREQKRLGEIVE